MTTFKPNSAEDQDISGVYSLGAKVQELPDSCPVEISLSDSGTPFSACGCSSNNLSVSDISIVVNGVEVVPVLVGGKWTWDINT